MKAKKKDVKKADMPAPKSKSDPVAPARKAVKPIKKAAPVKAPVAPPAKPKKAAEAPKPAEAEMPEAIKIKPLPEAELKVYRGMLQALRDRVVDEIKFLTGDNLSRGQKEATGDLSSYRIHMADQGTDNFDREVALHVASGEQDVLYEIDEAMGRITLKTYGTCEGCGCPIKKDRLKAMPFAKMCAECQSKAEKGRERYRRFGPSIVQSPES